MNRTKNILKVMLLAGILFNFPFSLFNSASAQKYACVNTDYIMHNMPDYVQAVSKLNKFSAEWQQELESKQQEVDNLRQNYQQEAYLLPDNLKQRRQDEIRTKETELRTLQQQRFGAGGDLDQKRAELLKPVQDRVYGAIERVAREKNYAFVFDRAHSGTVLYAGDRYDISNQVLEMLGVKPGTAQADPDAQPAQKSPKSMGSGGNNGNDTKKNRGSSDTKQKEIRR